MFHKLQEHFHSQPSVKVSTYRDVYLYFFWIFAAATTSSFISDFMGLTAILKESTLSFMAAFFTISAMVYAFYKIMKRRPGMRPLAFFTLAGSAVTVPYLAALFSADFIQVIFYVYSLMASMIVMSFAMSITKRKHKLFHEVLLIGAVSIGFYQISGVVGLFPGGATMAVSLFSFLSSVYIAHLMPKYVEDREFPPHHVTCLMAAHINHILVWLVKLYIKAFKE